MIVPVAPHGEAGTPTVIDLEGFDDSDARQACAVWAPDGRWVALAGGGEVWLVDTHTDAIRRLPDLRPIDLEWRPGTDYRKSYSARQEMGGGVILDICHEIDIAMAVFGDVKSVCCMARKVSNLDIDTEDVADIVFLHEKDKQSSLHLKSATFLPMTPGLGLF